MHTFKFVGSLVAAYIAKNFDSGQQRKNSVVCKCANFVTAEKSLTHDALTSTREIFRDGGKVIDT